MTDVVVVGSGPGGLAAAVTCARVGLDVLVLEAQPDVGGGLRTRRRDGMAHDACSAVHPLALASPFFGSLDLDVELAVPEASYAHPLDDEEAVIAWHDLDRMTAEVGTSAWQDTFAPLVERADDVVALAMGDHRSWPRGASADGARGDGLTGARLPVGRLAAAGALLARGVARSTTARGWGKRADALLAGVGAHATSGPGTVPWYGGAILLGTLAHAHGWPVPVGGSQAIADALVAELRRLGGRIEVDHPVRSERDLPTARGYLWDTSPAIVEQVYGARLGTRRSAYRSAGPGRMGAATVELVVSDVIPWADPRVALAPTVHLGGDGHRLRRAERLTAAGHHVRRPYVLLVDPNGVDASRTVPGTGPQSADLRPVSAYAHVPIGSGVDPAELVIGQIERFAPGVRDVVVSVRSTSAARLADKNANLEAGDIAGGRLGALGLFSRPTLVRDPFATGVPGAYLCSSSVPPGPGVHGMTGLHAARRLLRDVFGMTLPRA